MPERAGPSRAGRNRAGFTVIEVILALLLLSFMIMGFQAATGEIIHYAAQSDREAVAVHVVEDRLNLIRLDTDYEPLVTRYTEPATALADLPGLTRATVLDRTLTTTETGVLDYTAVTVTVEGAGLRKPVHRTIVIAAP